MDKPTAFQQYLADHPELKFQDVFPVFTVYNHDLSMGAPREAQKQAMEEVAAYVEANGSTPVLDEVLEKYTQPDFNASTYTPPIVAQEFGNVEAVIVGDTLTLEDRVEAAPPKPNRRGAED
jgi:hypothetical protein